MFAQYFVHVAKNDKIFDKKESLLKSLFHTWIIK